MTDNNFIYNGKWKVYYHHFPNDIFYIGITSCSLQQRWRNGLGYKGQKIYELIRQYDWNNDIKHFLFADHLTQEEANNIEKLLIKIFREKWPESIIYNIADGGSFSGGRQKIPIYQYTLQGEFIQGYSSMREAIDSVTGRQGQNSSHLREAAQGTIKKTAYGYLWSLEKKERLEPYEKNHAYNPVDQFDINGNFIQTFLNPYIAVKAVHPNVKNASNEYTCITKACSEQIRLYRGYQWRYYKEPHLCLPLPRKKSARIIDQYDLNENYIKTFIGLEDIQIELGLSSWPDGVLKVCNGKGKTAYGFKWKFNPTDNKIKNNYILPVYQKNLQGQIINKYNSIIEAAKQIKGARKDHIYECCIGKAKTHCGFKWSFVDKNNENTKI